jgi:hypothetical protein
MLQFIKRNAGNLISGFVGAFVLAVVQVFTGNPAIAALVALIAIFFVIAISRPTIIHDIIRAVHKFNAHDSATFNLSFLVFLEPSCASLL